MLDQDRRRRAFDLAWTDRRSLLRPARRASGSGHPSVSVLLDWVGICERDEWDPIWRRVDDLLVVLKDGRRGERRVVRVGRRRPLAVTVALELSEMRKVRRRLGGGNARREEDVAAVVIGDEVAVDVSARVEVRVHRLRLRLRVLQGSRLEVLEQCLLVTVAHVDAEPSEPADGEVRLGVVLLAMQEVLVGLGVLFLLVAVHHLFVLVLRQDNEARRRHAAIGLDGIAILLFRDVSEAWCGFRSGRNLLGTASSSGPFRLAARLGLFAKVLAVDVLC